jgi:hypothetical protein
LTQQRFGKVIRLFAPLYLSNECINNCQYCGFSRDNPILRVTDDDRIMRHMDQLGFLEKLLEGGRSFCLHAACAQHRADGRNENGGLDGLAQVRVGVLEAAHV